MDEWRMIVFAINAIVVASYIVSWLCPRPRSAAASLEAMLFTHEANMKSDDPAAVAEAARRWAVVCEKLKSRSDTYQMGCDLEAWGKSLEKPS